MPPVVTVPTTSASPCSSVAHEPEELALEDRDRGERGRVEPVDRLHRAHRRRRELVELGESRVVDVAQHVAAVGRCVGRAQLGRAGAEDSYGIADRSRSTPRTSPGRVASMSARAQRYRASVSRLSAMITAGTTLKLMHDARDRRSASA